MQIRLIVCGVLCLPYKNMRDFIKMAKLFIYFSVSGNGDLVAERMKEKEYDVVKVIPKKKLPKSFFGLIMQGGFLAGIKNKMKIEDLNVDYSTYKEIAVGSPIWNGRITPPINTVIADENIKDKITSFVFYAGGGEAPKTIERINKEFPNANIVILKEPKKYPEELEKL